MENQSIYNLLHLKKINKVDTIFSEQKYEDMENINVHLEKHL